MVRVNFRLCTAILGLALSPSFVASESSEPRVTLDKSKVTYRGKTVGSVEHFQNIKFAQDTSGIRRFAPPEPYVPEDGSEIDATVAGAACPQSKPGIPPFFEETPNISEDCLNLRISRLADTTPDSKLPVVVHLHGGGVVKGSAYDAHFDPDHLLELSGEIGKPIIYVALNYRLTIFGFARLPILKEQKSMNNGMRDQRAGFQWVKDNIAAFGGDPDRITIFGLSSGGTFSSLQPMAFGGAQDATFSQIWAMSGPPGTALNITSDVTELHTRAVATELGCDQEVDEEVLACLRGVSMEKLTEVAMGYSVKNHPPAGLFTFIPSIDEDFLPDRQSALCKTGRFAKGIAIVLGWTQDDGAANAGLAPSFQTEDDMKAPIQSFAHALTDDDYRRLFALYPATDFEEEVASYKARKSESDPDAPVHYFRVSRMLRDMLFTCSSIDFGHAMSTQSKALDPDFAGVRLYDLNQSMLTPLFRGAGMPYFGVPHGSDTNYLFNVFPEGQISEEDALLAKSMGTAFIMFAHTGVPVYEKDEAFSTWPEAFSSEGLSSLSVEIIGGPLGTGPGTVGGIVAENLEDTDGMQVPLAAELKYGEMDSPAEEARTRQLERERLLQRCAFINGLSEKLGV